MSKQEDEDMDEDALRQSSIVNDAMQLTARLWSRQQHAWPEVEVDKSMGDVCVERVKETAAAAKKKRKQKKENPRPHQQRAYMQWKESCVQDWWRNLLAEKEPPNKEVLAPSSFPAEAVDSWKHLQRGCINCFTCLGLRKRRLKKIMCLGACQTELPEEQYFVASMIKEWIAEKTLNYDFLPRVWAHLRQERLKSLLPSHCF